MDELENLMLIFYGSMVLGLFIGLFWRSYMYVHAFEKKGHRYKRFRLLSDARYILTKKSTPELQEFVEQHEDLLDKSSEY